MSRRSKSIRTSKMAKRSKNAKLVVSTYYYKGLERDKDPDPSDGKDSDADGRRGAEANHECVEVRRKSPGIWSPVCRLYGAVCRLDLPGRRLATFAKAKPPDSIT